MALRTRSCSLPVLGALLLIPTLVTGSVLAGASEPDSRERWVEETLASLSIREKAAQMIMPWVMGDFSPVGSSGHDRAMEIVREHRVGGILISVGTPVDVAVKLNELQAAARVPLLVSADLETGAGFRMRGAWHLPGLHDLGGATQFPPLMAVGATRDGSLAYDMGRITAVEARAVGIHMPFAPVLDLNSNPENPIINTRAFGEDPDEVAAMGVCFIRGLQEHGGIATAKHFPGHGDTDTDSHLALPVIERSMEALRAQDLVPFREAVAAGVGAVMTAHISLPRVIGEPGLPATLSREVATELLRGELGFRGLVVTDAMDMGGVDRRYPRGEAVVRAIEAGADILVMPPDVERALDAIEGAVRSGRLPEGRLDDSVRRILQVKVSRGLHLQRQVDVQAINRWVGIQEHLDVADEIARRSLTLVRNDGILPLRGTPGARVVSVTYRRAHDLMAGRSFDAELGRTYRNLVSHTVGHASTGEDYERVLKDARTADLVVVSLHLAAVAYGNGVALPGDLSAFLDDLREGGTAHVVVSFGSPYVLQSNPEVRALLLAWGGSRESQVHAARALFGRTETPGALPIRLPPHADRLHGMDSRSGPRSAPALAPCGR